jgi:hypothetical protein
MRYHGATRLRSTRPSSSPITAMATGITRVRSLLARVLVS